MQCALGAARKVPVMLPSGCRWLPSPMKDRLSSHSQVSQSTCAAAVLPDLCSYTLGHTCCDASFARVMHATIYCQWT